MTETTQQPTKLQLWMAPLIFFLGWILTPALISAFLLINYLGPDFMLLATGDLDLSSPAIIRIFSIASFIGAGVTTFTLTIVFGRYLTESWTSAKKDWHHFWKYIILGVFLTMGVSYLGMFISRMFTDATMPANQATILAMQRHTPGLIVIMAIVFASISEEIVFRLSLMNLFKVPAHVSIMISSTLFAMLHVTSDPNFILPYFLMALVFGVIYHRSKNIWVVILLHALHNAISIGIGFLMI